MRKLLILDPFREEHLEKIKEAAAGEFQVEILVGAAESEIREALKDAEIVVGEPSIEWIQNPEVNCPKLKFIQMNWAGTDIYTRSALEFPKHQVSLANASGTYGMIMSQFVVGQIISLMLNFKVYHEQQTKQIWKRQGAVLSLQGAKVLIFGAGDIGGETAKRLIGFSVETIGVCRNTDKPRKYFDKLCTLEEAEEYLSEADVIVGCIPNTSETEAYLNKTRLGMLKETAVIVNVGRGNFIDCLALDELLKEGKIWGAALDVTNPEPLPVNHPLWSNDRCIITPHTSGTSFGQSKDTEDLLCSIVCDNINRYRNNLEINNKIY